MTVLRTPDMLLLLSWLAASATILACAQGPILAPGQQLPQLATGSVPSGSVLPVLPSPPLQAPAASLLGTPAIGAVGSQQSGYAVGLQKPPFPLGAATAAFQVEGAASTDGRGPSIWDTYQFIPGKIKNGDNAVVADDFYDRYLDDIATAQALGLKLMRISISWSRVLPNGSGQVNQKGINFYSRVIDAIVAAGIEPHVTLYHWDFPQALQDAYGGWLSPQSITDFTAYAKIIFTALGDRVKHWTTFNEIQTFVQQGYNIGSFAPGRCSNRTVCPAGDSNTEPWYVLHNVLLAHGNAAAALRAVSPSALISCNFNVNWVIPISESADDQAAVQRYLDWHLGIYADPLFFGNFPASVLASGLPGLSFTQEEQNLLRGSVNYFALNHYTTNYVASYNGQLNAGDGPQELNVAGSTQNTGNTATYTAKNGVPIGPQAASSWLWVYPPGMRAILKYVDSYYKKPIIYITECGTDIIGESSLPLPQALNDTFRLNYFQGYIQNAIDAVVQDGVNVQGFFAWSLLDNFEWLQGYENRFGIVHVDFKGGLVRYAKESAKFLAAWFQGVTLKSSTNPTSPGNVASFSIG